MNINTIKKFLEETKFKAVNYQTFGYAQKLHHYELYEIMTEDGQTLGIALHECSLCGKISIYKNNKFVVCFNTLIVLIYIKKAFSKHFDEVIEDWKKEEKK